MVCFCDRRARAPGLLGVAAAFAHCSFRTHCMARLQFFGCGCARACTPHAPPGNSERPAWLFTPVALVPARANCLSSSARCSILKKAHMTTWLRKTFCLRCFSGVPVHTVPSPWRATLYHTNAAHGAHRQQPLNRRLRFGERAWHV